MFSSRALLVLAVVTPLAVFAAPVPESVSHAKAFKNTFGTSHASHEGSSFRFDGTTLTAMFPKGWSGTNSDHLRCLRTERTVTGDFDVTVAVRTTAPVIPPKAAGAKRCDLGGGLAVWQADAKDPTTAVKDEKGRAKAVSVARYYTFLGEPREGDPRCWEWGDIAHYPGMVYDGTDEGGDPTETTHLRITRRDNLITTAKSADGENWKTIATEPRVELPAAVSVGVWAFEGTGRGYEVVFEKFTLKQK